MKKSHDKYIRMIRKGIRGIEPVIKKVKRTKDILLYCDSITMEEHIIDFYENIKTMKDVRFFLFYIDGQNDYKKDNQEEGIQRIVTGRNIISIKKYEKVVFHSWDLIVCADTFLPFHFEHKDAPAIYINHGLHIISFDEGDNLYAYTDHWALDIDGEPKFAVMCEPNKRYVEILKKEKPKLENVIQHVGYKYSENILEEKKNYHKYRQQFGVKEDEIVVAVFSTWRKECLFQSVGHELVNECKKLQDKGYRFILSDHPREYFRYDQSIEPSGPYVDSLEKEGFIIRKPEQNYIPYLIASDVVICDYSTFYELALIAGKKLILSDFPEKRVWKHSIARELMRIVPVFKKDTNLQQLIQHVIDSDEYQRVFEKYAKELITENMSYQDKMKEIVQRLIKQTRR